MAAAEKQQTGIIIVGQAISIKSDKNDSGKQIIVIQRRFICICKLIARKGGLSVMTVEMLLGHVASDSVTGFVVPGSHSFCDSHQAHMTIQCMSLCGVSL